MDKFVVDLDQLLNDFEQSEQSRILGEIDPNLRHESKAINANDEPQLIVFDESDHIKVSHSSASDETEACHTMTDPISFSKKCDNEKENHVERSASNVSKTELIDQPNCSKEFIANDTNQEQPYSLLLIDGLHKEGAVTVESPKSIDEIQNCCDQSEKKEIKNESIIDQDPIESCSSDLLANLLKPNLPESRPSEINQSIDRENGQSVLDLLDNCPIDFQPLTVNANQNDLILNDDVLLDSREIVDNAFMPSQESNYKISDENKVDCDSNEKIRDSNKVPSDSTQSNTVFHAESDSDVIFTDKLNQPDSSRSFAQMDLVLSENSCPTSNDPTVDEFEPKLTSSTANHPSDNAAPELNSDLTTSQNFTAMQTNRDENLEHVTQDDSSPTPSQFQPLPSLTNSIGYVRPYWMPDQEAPNCLGCSLRFTVIKRRHHCRACGKVYCAACSTQKAKLPYMDFKEARVCATCFDLLDHGKLISDLINKCFS